MKYYIKITNGEVEGYPLVHDNFVLVYPDIDTENLPPEWAVFTPTDEDAPNCGVYEKLVQTFVKTDTGVTDVWVVQAMTDQEKLNKQNQVKQSVPYNSWIFVEETCSFAPPVPLPTNTDIVYKWDEPTLSWVEATKD